MFFDRGMGAIDAVQLVVTMLIPLEGAWHFLLSFLPHFYLIA